MKHKFSLNTNYKQFALLNDKGESLFIFDKGIFNDLSIIKGLAVNMVVQFAKENFDSTDQFVVIDETEVPHSTCTKCGSINVEVKAWLNENTGFANPVEEPDNEDTWCPVCEGHHGITMETKNYELYNSEGK